MSQIAVRNIIKKWSGDAAVDDVSFVAEEGHFLVLLGPSGCGKSTTLRLIAGLEEPDSGTVMIAGQDVTRWPPDQRRISMVFQSYALFPHLDVAENIVFGLKVRRTSAAERRRRLNRVSEMVGIGSALKKKPAQLSGGQRQRVALARALVAENPILLMDEPLSNLDAQLHQDMRVEIRSLQRRLGMTVIYVTHDQIEAMSMADNVILMRGGNIEQIADPDEIYTQPETVFSAQFIGTPPMNLIPLADGVDGTVIAGTIGPTVFPRTGAELYLGVRPEDITLSESGGAQAEIRHTDYQGADTVLTVRAGDADIKVRIQGHYRGSVGEKVLLEISKKSMLFFDSKSGLRYVAENAE